MPDPKRLLRTLQLSVQAFRDTPGRRGRLIQLLDATEVLVAGDLHGHIDNLRLILQKAELDRQPGRHLVLQELIHGPFSYPEGGDKSHQLLDLLAALKCQYPRQVHMLLGNHELAQWTGQWIAKGEIDLNEAFRQGVKSAYGPSADKVYDAYRELFAAVPLAVRTANRVFVSHSLPAADRLEKFDPALLKREAAEARELLPGGAIHSLVWGRDTSLSTATAFLHKVDADLLVTGHVPCEQGFQVPNDRQLILDALGTPACYCLFPADRPLSQRELLDCVKTL